jgi:hypothetical protein
LKQCWLFITISQDLIKGADQRKNDTVRKSA